MPYTRKGKPATVWKLRNNHTPKPRIQNIVKKPTSRLLDWKKNINAGLYHFAPQPIRFTHYKKYLKNPICEVVVSV